VAANVCSISIHQNLKTGANVFSGFSVISFKFYFGGVLTPKTLATVDSYSLEGKASLFSDKTRQTEARLELEEHKARQGSLLSRPVLKT